MEIGLKVVYYNILDRVLLTGGRYTPNELIFYVKNSPYKLSTEHVGHIVIKINRRHYEYFKRIKV